jgi:hypothetical protein
MARSHGHDDSLSTSYNMVGHYYSPLLFIYLVLQFDEEDLEAALTPVSVNVTVSNSLTSAPFFD